MISPKHQRLTTILSPIGAVFVMIITIVVFLLIAPDYAQIKPSKVDPYAVSVLPHNGVGPFRRKRVNEVDYNLITASQLGYDGLQQYTVSFELDAVLDTPMRLLIPHMGGTANVYMNGVIVGSEQKKDIRIPGFSGNYIAKAIPFTTYQLGTNRLTVVLDPDASNLGIPAIFIGPPEPLVAFRQEQARTLRALHVTLMIAAIFISFCAILGLSFRQNRALTIYGPLLLAGLCLMGVTMAWSEFVSEALPVYVQIAVITVMYGLTIIAVFLLLWATSIYRNFLLYGFGMSALLSLCVAILYALPIANTRLFIPVLAPFVITGALPFLLTMSVRSIWKERTSITASKADMERTITEQEKLILSQKRKMEDTLRAKGRLEERQRLTRDIHDGIGGQLLSLLVRVREGEMSQAEIEDDLQYGINDLRLIVDSMDHSDSSFETALVTFRARTEAQLKAAKIKLLWDQSQFTTPTHLGPAVTLHLYRLMQEIISNAVKHAACSTLSVTIARKSVSDPLSLSLNDNGCGFDINANHIAGQGLKNIAYRAKAIGAELSVESHAGEGTQFILVIAQTGEHD